MIKALMVSVMYDVLKSLIDPVFIIFVLLLIYFLRSSFFGKQKGGGLFLLFIIVLLYGFSIQPVSGYLSYQLEKNYIKSLHVDEKAKLDVVAVLSGTNYPRFRNRADFYCVAIGIGLKMRKEIDSIDSFNLCRNRSKTFLREESWILRSALPIKTSPRGAAWP
jgi:hypothetical protein